MQARIVRRYSQGQSNPLRRCALRVRPAGETKYVTYAGEITFGRTEDRLKERCPIVRRQIGVRNGDWNRCSAMGRRTCLDVRDSILYWQERILTLGRAEIGNPKLIANLPEVDAIDCFNEERQAIVFAFPCSWECLL